MDHSIISDEIIISFKLISLNASTLTYSDHNKNSTARTRTHTCGSYIYIAGVEIFK